MQGGCQQAQVTPVIAVPAAVATALATIAIDTDRSVQAGVAPGSARAKTSSGVAVPACIVATTTSVLAEMIATTAEVNTPLHILMITQPP